MNIFNVLDVKGEVKGRPLVAKISIAHNKSPKIQLLNTFLSFRSSTFVKCFLLFFLVFFNFRPLII